MNKKRLILVLVLFVFSLLSAGIGNSWNGVCGGMPNGIAGVAAGQGHNCILKSNGNVDCYGFAAAGQAEDYMGEDAVGVAAGFHNTCILKKDGSVVCYGEDKYGETGDYFGGDAIGVAVGGYHTCILKNDGNVDCYGYNSYGQANDYTSGDAIGVAASWELTCILKSSGNVDCYGNNQYGQANDYTGGDAVGVATGWSYTCILKSNGNVDCYGYNQFGAAEDYNEGDAIGIVAGESVHTCILKSNGNVFCYGDNRDGESNDYFGGDAVGFAAGERHTCILKSNGNVDCYGNNWFNAATDYLGGDAICPSLGPVCGNGVIEGIEVCDDSNRNNNDNCKNDCTLNICGDGYTYSGVEACETNAECDDNNQYTVDSCDSCVCINVDPVVCGDGNIDSGEECDSNALGGQNCEGLGFTSGSLACDISCTFDKSNCVEAFINVEIVCNDNLDNDKDDSIDCADSDCGKICELQQQVVTLQSQLNQETKDRTNADNSMAADIASLQETTHKIICKLLPKGLLTAAGWGDYCA